jgi:hypothetical protein
VVAVAALAIPANAIAEAATATIKRCFIWSLFPCPTERFPSAV